MSESTRIEELPLAEVVPDPVVVNHREDFDEEKLARLAENIRAEGQLVPALVRPSRNGAGWWLVAGERRWRALGLIGAATIRAEVRDLSDEEAAKVQAAENLARVNPNPVEEGWAIRRYIEAMRANRPYLPEEELVRKAAAANDRSVREANRRLALLELPDEVQALVKKGDLGEGQALALLPLIERGDEEAKAEAIRLARRAVSQNWLVREVRAAQQAYLGSVAQGSMFGADEGRATKEQRATRDVLGQAIALFERVQRIAFDERKQEFRLGDLGESELEAAEGKLAGAAKTAQALLAEVRRAQGKVEEVPAAVAPSHKERNEAPHTREETEGASPPERPEEAKADSPLRVRMERDWLWVYDAPGPGESPLSWKLYRAGARWAKTRGAWYAPTPRDIEAVRAVLEGNPVKEAAA